MYTLAYIFGTMNTKQQLAAIIESGLTQSEVAARVGLTQPTISRILSEKHRDIRARTAVLIDGLYKEVVASRRGMGDAA